MPIDELQLVKMFQNHFNKKSLHNGKLLIKFDQSLNFFFNSINWL